MTADIVSRLREKRGVLDNRWPGPSALEMEAASEIERLRKALTDILAANDEFRAGMPDDWDGDPLQDVCAAAKQLVTKHRPDPELDHTLSVVSDALNATGE